MKSDDCIFSHFLESVLIFYHLHFTYLGPSKGTVQIIGPV